VTYLKIHNVAQFNLTIGIGRPGSENLNLMIQMKFLNLSLYSSKSKPYKTEQSFTGLGPEYLCSS
jgi:hypothetical protein